MAKKANSITTKLLFYNYQSHCYHYLKIAFTGFTPAHGLTHRAQEYNYYSKLNVSLNMYLFLLRQTANTF